MSQELQLGKYEFFPYEDKPEESEDILNELKELLTTNDKAGKGRKDIIEKFIRREKPSAKKKHPRSKG